jgi:putative membrane protein
MEITMTRFIYATVAAISLFAISAQAQTPTPAAPAPSTTTTMPPTAPPMAKVPDAGAPLPGANSFTEAQATARIAELGYSNVSGLAKDADGVWRGTATKDGKTTSFALDFKGNIVVGQK